MSNIITKDAREQELKRLCSMTDDEAYANALSDPDNPPLPDAQLENMVLLRSIPGETLQEKLQHTQKRRKIPLATPVDDNTLQELVWEQA